MLCGANVTNSEPPSAGAEKIYQQLDRKAQETYGKSCRGFSLLHIDTICNYKNHIEKYKNHIENSKACKLAEPVSSNNIDEKGKRYTLIRE